MSVVLNVAVALIVSGLTAAFLALMATFIVLLYRQIRRG